MKYYKSTLVNCGRKHLAMIQVYVPQNTTVPQNTSLIYFPYKIWKKGTKYFIQVNVY